jgi:signal transduction histidine kinase
MGNHGAASARQRAAAGERAELPAGGNSRSSRPVILSNWTVSQRLFAVIALALLMGLVFGGLRVAGAEGSAAQFGQVSGLANLGVQDTAAIQGLQDERDATVGPLTAGISTSSGASSLAPYFAATNAAAARVRQAAAGVGGGLPANIAADISTVLADVSPARILALQNTLRSGEDVSAEISSFGAPITDMITLNDLIAQGVSDAALANSVRALNFLSLAKEEVSQQRAILLSLFSDPYFVDGEPSPTDSGLLSALNLAGDEERVDEAAFLTTATPTEEHQFNAALGSPGAGQAAEIEDFVFGNAPTAPATAPLNPNPLAVITTLGFTLKQAPQQWYTAMSAKLDALRGVEQTITADIATRAQALQQAAQRSAVVNGIITAVVLLLVLGAALLVARSLVRPLRQLRIGALHIASTELPERVKHLSEAPDPAANLAVAPIDVLTADEIGQVARAFDQVHAEAVRLAGNEALLRASFNAVFVNLSRRSQSLIERLARMIDSLEQNEDDPGLLSSLFSMDHLVTRMRRNSENLLLLAGHEGARKWSEPVAIADVARAATAEIEQYSRVGLNIQPGVAVIGQAVSDVVHLLAELIENATLFSPKDTKVQVTAQELSSGGVLIEIADNGIGISESRLAEMNWRLDNPPVMDVSVSRHMGLFAVARLAERHQIRVRLRPVNPQGLSALVWLPDTVVERTPRGYSSGGAWSKPFGAQAGLYSRRSVSQQIIGTRSAVESRRQAAAAPDLAPDDAGSLAGEEDDQLMSRWFRSRRITATGVGTGNAAHGWQSAPPQGWSGQLASDPWAQGRHAAEIIADPIRGDRTAAGLPLRVPKANLLPGSAGPGAPGSAGPGAPGAPGGDTQDDLSGAQAQALPRRSPELARSRLSGFQRGARRAQARRTGGAEPSGSGQDERPAGFGRQDRGADS